MDYKKNTQYDNKTLDNDDIVSLNNKWLALYDSWKYEEAIEYYDKVLEIDPNYTTTLSNKWSLLQYLWRYEEAIESYDKLLKLESNSTNILNNKWLALHNLWRYEEAIESYDKALEITSNYAITLNNKWLALIFIWRYEEAIECYDKVLEKNPNDTKVIVDKALALYRLWRYEESIKFLDIALEITPNDQSILDKKWIVLQTILNSKKDKDSAEIFLENICKELNVIDEWYKTNNISDIKSSYFWILRKIVDSKIYDSYILQKFSLSYTLAYILSNESDEAIDIWLQQSDYELLNQWMEYIKKWPLSLSVNDTLLYNEICWYLYCSNLITNPLQEKQSSLENYMRVNCNYFIENEDDDNLIRVLWMWKYLLNKIYNSNPPKNTLYDDYLKIIVDKKSKKKEMFFMKEICNFLLPDKWELPN